MIESRPISQLHLVYNLQASPWHITYCHIVKMFNFCTIIFQNVIFWNGIGYLVLLVTLSKLLASLMRNSFPKRPSKLYDVPVGFVLPPHLRLCIALLAVAKGWLLLDIG